jgi:hypothetical protein
LEKCKFQDKHEKLDHAWMDEMHIEVHSMDVTHTYHYYFKGEKKSLGNASFMSHMNDSTLDERMDGWVDGWMHGCT